MCTSKINQNLKQDWEFKGQFFIKWINLIIKYNIVNLLGFFMTNLENTKALLDNYIFKASKPQFSSAGYQVHNAVQKQTKVPVTIKILSNYSNQQLPRYLKKLKQCKSENVIRIYELAIDSSKIVFVSQNVTFGNLANALQKCRRLEETDALSVAKMILNGYVDLLRSDLTWMGSMSDIQFTDNGLKLSWNNFTNFKSSLSISQIIQKISKRQQQSSLIPLPKNKAIQQLIKVSKQSASEISLNPQFKKKQKQIKKKGKNWLAIRQLSNKNQYMEQIVYLALNVQYGFVKVKIYDKGTIAPQLINLNKTKQNFTKVLQSYDQANKTIIVSEYSNDGNLQGYISKLKNSGVKLTEQQIQFFFFSLFEPIKQIQQSSIKSLGMLHIRNIYIQNSIPKIGQPVPMNQNLLRVLKQREDVPDFYHPKFKAEPNTRSQVFDTYSLGILLYKLMYTEYPIFPEGKVHIPTAPSYNKRLKTSLQILLNEGGTLKSIQSKIEVSEAVVSQVKQNKKQLQIIKIQNQPKKSVQLSKRALIQDIQETHQQIHAKSEATEQHHEQIDQDELGCLAVCCHEFDFSANQQAMNKYVTITSLEQSPYKIYRICTKIILVLVFYTFLFYFFFLKSNFSFLSNQSKFSVFNVKIATVNYPIITANSEVFETVFNQTSRNVASIQSLNCLIDGYNNNPTYSDMIIVQSSGWTFFLVSALLCYIIFMLLKGWQTYTFDLVKSIYNWDHGKSNFNISNFIVFNLLFCSLIHGHYFFYNLIFTGQDSPCVGSSYYYSTTYTLLNDSQKFLIPYLLVYIFQILLVLTSWIIIWRTQQIHYNKLVNPIFLLCPFLITQWIIIRIGVVNGYYYPNALQDGHIIANYILSISYVNILGMIPEILWIGELIIGLIVDSVYWCFLDKRRRLLIHDSSMASLSDIR